MQKNTPNGALKDIFSTILSEKSGSATSNASVPARIVVHGNGNVIAPGGTVHVTHAAHVETEPPGSKAAPRTSR